MYSQKNCKRGNVWQKFDKLVIKSSISIIVPKLYMKYSQAALYKCFAAKKIDQSSAMLQQTIVLQVLGHGQTDQTFHLTFR